MPTTWETMKPVPKVSASTAGAALGGILTWLTEALTILEPPAVVYIGMATIFAFILGWLVPDGES